jgi:hypothetical protein
MQESCFDRLMQTGREEGGAHHPHPRPLSRKRERGSPGYEPETASVPSPSAVSTAAASIAG